MKKLYRKGTVHPSPPTVSDQLSFLPAAILTLTAALSPEDKQVLAYLISCSSAAPFSRFSPGRNPAAAGGGGEHAPNFNCSCFGCYMSYWIRWDSSPNRQLIHEIIDAFEEWLAQKGGKKKNNNGGGRKEKRNKRGGGGGSSNKNQQHDELTRNELVLSHESSSESSESDSVVMVEGESSNKVEEDDGGSERVIEEEEKGSVRKLMSFIGGIWGWGQ